MQNLPLFPLTHENFAAFGEVIGTALPSDFSINGGTTERYHDLARVEVLGEDGHANISIGEAQPFYLPLEVHMLERHPLGSQAWIPLTNTPFIIVVAQNGKDDKPDEKTLTAFWANGNQGVNYPVGLWHHPLLNIGQAGRFLIVDRAGSAPNCDECDLSAPYLLTGEFSSES